METSNFSVSLVKDTNGAQNGSYEVSLGSRDIDNVSSEEGRKVIIGFPNVGPKASDDGMDTVAMFESCREVLVPRHNRATSGYVSCDVLDMSADDIEAEIQRVKAESAKIERHLAALSGTSDQLSSGSAASVDDSEARRPFQHVTTRDDRCQRGRQPTLVRQPSCSPTTSVDRQLPGRHPTTVRQLDNASSSTPSVRQQPVRQLQLRSSTNDPVRQHDRVVRQLPPVPDQRQLILSLIHI